MAQESPQPEAPTRRWRAYADGVAIALGLNVWLSLVVVPAIHVHALRSATHIALALAPIVPLGIGVWRRNELWLLGIFPSALLLPISVTPTIASPHLYGPLRFAVVAAGLVAYVLVSSFFAGFRESSPPLHVRPLASAADIPDRWRRRERVYWELVALAIALPMLGIYWVNFDSGITQFLAQMYPGRVARMLTLLNVTVLLLWLVLYVHVFLGALRPHRTGDRDVIATLSIARANAHRGRPRLQFHLAVVTALSFMAILVYLRHL